MKIKTFLLTSIISLSSFCSVAVSKDLHATEEAESSQQFITVCGYMPGGIFTEPVERTLTSDSGFPTCSPTILVRESTTTVITIPNPDGGLDIEIQTHTSQNVEYVLVYELPGGY